MSLIWQCKFDDMIGIAIPSAGECSSHHSPNDMTLLLTTSNVHDQETLTIR